VDAGAATGAPQLSVIVPAYNEAATLEECLRRVVRLGLDAELVVVDDGSRDGTAALLRRLADGVVPGLRVLSHPLNRGKGAAVRTGIAATRGSIVLILDADLEYDPNDIPRLVAPILDGYADVVFGTRLRGGGHPQRAHLFWHYVGNRFLSLLTNVLYNTTISDMEVGYKVFRGDLIRSVRLVSEGFGFEPEVTAKILRRGDVRLYELPISYFGRTYDEGKKVTWRDGAWAIVQLIRYRFGRDGAPPRSG
jgi:glycosyltransferase involved in cell wall biosynthesis